MDKRDKPLVNISVTEWVVILFKIFIASLPAWSLAVLVYIMLGGFIAGLLPDFKKNAETTPVRYAVRDCTPDFTE